MKGEVQHLLVMFILTACCLSIAFSASLEVNRHDEKVKPSEGDNKCTCSPCGCGGETAPPPPPPASPPPPPKTPSTPSCTPPPPPPAQTWYVIGTPGVLYPLDPQYYPSAAPLISSHAWPQLLFLGILVLLMG